jgi:hypothetical protein
MLFVHNNNHKPNNGLHHKPYPSPKPSRKRFFDSLLDTLHEWEGTTRNSHGIFILNDTLPSGRMSLDFMCYQPDEMAKGLETGEGRPESAKTMLSRSLDEEVPRPNKVRDAISRKERGQV